MALKTRKDVTIYISCLKGSLGALRGGGGGLARARGERDTREKAEEKLFILSFLPRAPRVVLVPWGLP